MLFLNKVMLTMQAVFTFCISERLSRKPFSQRDPCIGSKYAKDQFIQKFLGDAQFTNKCFPLFLNPNTFSIVILLKSIVIYKDTFAMTQKKSYAARINYLFYKMAVLFGKKSPTFPELPLK